ncbi:MAG: GAF domain-containing protein, partial [Chloroflexota bacterium]
MAGYGATALPGVGGPGRRRIIQWYRFRSERAGLRSQLLALLVLIWLFTLLVVGGVVYRNASVFERSFWEQRQREVASYATRTLTSFIQDTLSRLSGLGLIDPRDREGLSQRLDAFLEATPAVSEVVWLDAQGRVLGSAYRREPVLANLLTIPQSYWFHESTAGRTYLGSVQLSAANQPYLIVSVPVEGKQVLAARMRLDLLWDLAADLGFGRSGVIYLVNRRGEILAHPDPNLVLTQASILGLPELEQALQSDGGVWTGAYHSLSGTAVRGLAMQASGLDWIVIAEMDEEEQGSFSRDLLSMLTGLLGMVGVAVFLGVALVLDRLVLTPVEAMRAGAEKIRTGRLDHRVPVYRQDEVGKVAGAFNEMAAQLQQTLAGLTERAAALEASQRVTFAAAEAEDGAELFNLVANLIRDQFHLYHVQVLLLDRDARRADLFSGTGYAGIQMLRVGYFVPVSGEMPAARALRDGEAVLVEDRDQLDGVRAFLPDACSQLALPMAAQRGMIGVLDLYSSRPGAFPPELVSLLQAMAKQAALSYENRRLLEQTSAQADDLRYFTSQLSTASEVGWRVNQIRDPGQVLKEMTGLMQSRFGYYHVYVYLLDENQEYLALHTASDEVGQVLIQRRHRLPLHSQDKNLIASAARSGRPALVNDVSLISDYRPTPLLPETRAELAVPLVAGECVLGVIDVQDDQPNRFRQSDVDAFSAMAAQITVALENARLFRELEQTAERLREVDRLKSEFLA